MKLQIAEIPGLNAKTYEVPDLGDYISLTNLAISQGGADLLTDWLRNKNTIEFLGVWERLNNPDFDETAFNLILASAGVNRFRLPVKKWVKDTNATGITAKSGRQGGTFAHIDIALEFAGWLNPSFRLFVITEFKRFKKQEAERQDAQLDWNVQRLLTKSAYRVHTDAVQQVLVAENLPREKSGIVYASEADLLNIAVFGCTAGEFRSNYPDRKGNMRDYASIEQLLILNQLESQNALLIRQGVSKQQRLVYLKQEAERQMKSLSNQSTPKSLELAKIND